MKTTNLLLIILICLIAWQKIPMNKQEVFSPKKEIQEIVFGETVRKTKDVVATPLDKNKKETKHSSTLRNYTDSDGRVNTSINHNIRVGRSWYVSSGLYSRQSDYQTNYGAEATLTYYWN